MIDVVTVENGWTITSSWDGRIECDQCHGLYRFIPDGRGVALINEAEAQQHDALKSTMKGKARTFLNGPEVDRVLSHVAASLEALPTVAARYQLAVELGLESATLPTFRKHVRDTPMRRWLDWHVPEDGEHFDRTLSSLLPLYAFSEVGAGKLRACMAEIETLAGQARRPPHIVMSLGPINIFAAVSSSRNVEA